jgi:hypothetical protein
VPARQKVEFTMPYTIAVGARSLFVTCTAWLVIVLASLATVSAVVQNAGVAASLPGLHLMGLGRPAPWLTGLLLDYLPWVVGAGLVLSVATLGCAVGLLLRVEWARRFFIGLLVLAIVANLLGLWLQHELVQSLVTATLSRAPLPQEAAGVFGGFVVATRSMAVLMTLAACGLLGWVIRRLMSPMVRQEFA